MLVSAKSPLSRQLTRQQTFGFAGDSPRQIKSPLSRQKTGGSPTRTSSPLQKDDDVVAAAIEGLKSCWRLDREEAIKKVGGLGIRAAPHARLLGACALNDVELSVRLAAVAALGSLGEAGWAELIRALDGNCLRVHEAAENELRAAGEAALPKLRVALTDSSCAVRLAAAGLVGQQRDIANVRAAKACRVAANELVHAEAAVRGHAADALALLGPHARHYVDDLVLLMRGHDVEAACDAVAALGCAEAAIRPILDEACTILSVAVKSKEPVERLAAAKAVGCLGQGASSLLNEATEVALELLDHGEWEVKIHAAEALARLGSCDEISVSRHGARQLRRARQNTAAILHEDYVEAQCAAVVAVGGLEESGTSHRVEACAAAAMQLKSSLPGVRVAAAAALGSLGETYGPEANKAVKVAADELLDADSAIMVRLDACRAIGLLGHAAADFAAWANEIAEHELQNKEPLVRVAAAAAIGSLIKEASDENTAAAVAVAELSNKDWHHRAIAAHALYLLGPAASLHADALAAALRDDKAVVRDNAASALAKCAGLGKEGLGHLAVAMRDRDWKARSAAAKALQAVGYSDAPDHLTIKAMRDA